MKKLIYTIALCLSAIAFSQTEIQTEANFNGRHCRGTVGLCNIDSGDMAKNNINSTLVYDTKQGLLLNIKIDNLSNEDLSNAFGSAINGKNNDEELQLIVEEDFVLDYQLLKTLNVPKESVTIKAGNYAVSRKDNTATVLFVLD